VNAPQTNETIIHSTPAAIAQWRSRRDYYGADAAEWLRRWDEGALCWTISMGGLGPSYEQAIQILVAEIIRDNLNARIPQEGEKFGDWGDATVSRIDAKDPVTGQFAMGGYSGAQVGAAKSLAWHFLTNGPGQTLIDCDRHGIDDRRLMVSKFFPKAPEASVSALEHPRG
jgi:hypothetical protein